MTVKKPENNSALFWWISSQSFNNCHRLYYKIHRLKFRKKNRFANLSKQSQINQKWNSNLNFFKKHLSNIIIRSHAIRYKNLHFLLNWTETLIWNLFETGHLILEFCSYVHHFFAFFHYFINLWIFTYFLRSLVFWLS